MTADTDTHAAEVAQKLPEGSAKKLSLFDRIGEFFGSSPIGTLMSPGLEPTSLKETVRIGWHSPPFALTLGDVALEFHPDLAITGDEIAGDREWIVHAGAEFYQGIPNFIRIKPGETVVLGRGDELQKRVFAFNKSVAGRHVRLFNRKGELTIQPLELDRSTTVSAIDSPVTIWEARRTNLIRLPDILGHPPGALDDGEALTLIRNVNAIMAREDYRDPNDEGLPGGIIQLPDDMTVLILGDTHARLDNVLRVLTEGGLLDALATGAASLVLLGDVVHSQEPGELEEMESSVRMLDLFSMLKCRFPSNVFYIHGNHESFSPNIGKGGVPQAILFRKYLKERRGKAYVAEVSQLFDGLAFVVQGKGFAACHGAPVRSRVDRNTLVNIRRYPGIQHELVWNRLRQGNRPAGYGKGSVRRFRQTLNLPKHAPVIVGHTPLSSDETLWLNVGGITGHHVVYSAYRHRMAAIVMKQGCMTPLEFVPEPALEFLDSEPKA